MARDVAASASERGVPGLRFAKKRGRSSVMPRSVSGSRGKSTHEDTKKQIAFDSSSPNGCRGTSGDTDLLLFSVLWRLSTVALTVLF